MEENRYSELTREECFVAYQDILRHAENKWQDAVALAQRGSYGSAISYHIVSIEETVKAFIFLLDSAGFEFRKVKGINRLLQNHQARYVVMMGINIIYILGNDLLELFNRYKDNIEELTINTQKLINNDPTIHKLLDKYFDNKIEQFKEILKDFSQLDKLRQSGMYVDYNEEIETPLNITISKYQKEFEKMNAVRSVFTVFFDAFTSNNNDNYLVQYFNELRIDMESRGYSQLGTALMKRGNVFLNVEKYFTKQK